MSSFIIKYINCYIKFSQSYLLNTKESLEVFSKIRSFIAQYGAPKYLITDNGKEFKNKILRNY